MATDFPAIVEALKAVFSKYEKKLDVKADSRMGYMLTSRLPSPFPQHKGQPMFFGAVRTGKAYVSFHLVPLYMSPELDATVSPALLKRRQGKSCFNFKSVPDAELLTELKALTKAGFDQWKEKKWL